MSSLTGIKALLQSSQRRFWGCVVVLFLVGLMFKLHFSSEAIWDVYLGGPKATTQGVIFGSPKAIRSDEWMLGLPWVLSQANNGDEFSPNNTAIGSDTSALLVGLPTKHWTSIFRVPHWGYFFLDTERGFSWHWLCRTFLLLVSFFVFFYQLSGRDRLLACSGALWLYFSAFNQWWLGSVAELLLSFVLSCLGLRGLLRARVLSEVIGYGVLLLIGAVNFFFSLYPPFQIPMAYLGLALLPLLFDREDVKNFGELKLQKIICFVALVSIAAFTTFRFISDNSAVIATLQNTVYPGHRITFGGGYDYIRYFSGLFDATYLDGRLPLRYGNVCEASSFILFWPLSLLVLLISPKRSHIFKFLPLIIYMVGCSIWILHGWSEALSKYSLWSMVPPNRAFIGLGFASIAFTGLVFASGAKISRYLAVLLSVAVAIPIYRFIFIFDAYAQDVIPDKLLYLSAFGSWLLVVSILFSSRLLLFIAVCIAVVIPNGAINPLTSGLDSIMKTDLYRSIQKIGPKDGEGWIVYGPHWAPQLAKAAGAQVLNGANYAPNLGVMGVIDAEKKYVDVYNRYAHGLLNPLPEGSPQATFQLLQPDTWQLDIDPCNPKLQQLGIKYVVFAPRRRDLKYSCLELVTRGEYYSILKRIGS